MDLELRQEQVGATARFSTVETVVKEHVQKVLEHFDGNKTKTAKELGVPRATFYRWVKKWGIK